MKLGCARRSFLGAGLFAGLVAACASEPPRDSRIGQKSQSLFSNGGFESGTLEGWTLTTYSNTPAGLPRDPAVSPPQTLADLGLVAGGGASSTALSGASEAQVPRGLIGASPTSTLRYPKYGSWTGVVNEGGIFGNANSLKQSSVTTSADVDPLDGRVHVRFALAAVLQSPGHTAQEQPYFFAIVRNLSKGGTLFTTFNFANQPGVAWMEVTDALGALVVYTHWQDFDVAPASDELAVGDRVELEVVAVGCALGGHYGEVYVDAFGSSSCSSDLACTQDSFCSGGRCTPKLLDGALCAADGACANGFCVDGVCCDGACVGACDACNLPGLEGRCTLLARGSPGKPACHPYVCSGVAAGCPATCSGDAACAEGYFCAGGACTLKKGLGVVCSGGNECASNLCADGVCCNAACAGPCEACNVGAPIGTCTPLVAGAAGSPSCAPYVCGGQSPSCPTSCATDSQCAAGRFCAGGTCAPKKGNAAPCSAANQCASGACADGVCCSAPCTGACDTCTAPGAVGTCTLRAAGAAGAPSCSPFVCGGASAACPTSCEASAACAVGSFCEGGACKPRLGLGRPCSSDESCASGHCVDGVCCNSACLGQCEACGAAGSEGTCAAVSGAPRGSRSRCADDGSGCGGACSGADRQACAYPKQQVPCRAPSCEAGVATLAAACDGRGECPALQRVACDPYRCSGASCAGDCARDADCAADHFCAGGVCKPKLEPGVSCAGGAQCASGHCADGVCCDGACLGQCEACDLPGKAGACSPVSGAPRGGRAACASDGAKCAGSCDGEHRAACAYPGASVPCRAAACAQGVATLAAACDGAGSCPSAQTVPCAPYTCGEAACAGNCQADGDCAAGYTCAGGVCAGQKSAGEPCARGGQCASGHCADGVCCDGACLGQCEACDLPGTAGTCSPAIGAPHGLRAACASDGSACGGTCDGAVRAGCAYPGASAQCRAPSCQDGMAILAAGCDGQGACPAAQVQACAPFTCGGSACRGECTDSSHCQAGSFCSGGICQPRRERSEPCAGDEQCATGHCADGVCCDGACAGQCEACDAVGKEGTCAAIAGAPRGGRPACAGAGLCQGQCGGELADRCIYPGADAICSPDTCEDGVRRARASCDGQGRCGGSTAADCGGFACSGLDCKTSCAGDGDCAPKAVCVNGACQRLAPSALAMAGGCGCGAGAGEGGTWLAALVALAAAGRTRRRALR